MNQSIFKDENGTSTLAEYQAMDFTKIYKKHIKAINLNPLKGDTYPLQHKTAGIYSDYTHIHIKSGVDEKLYQNTFNIYVLPNLNAVGQNKIPLDYTLNEASRLYCEDDSCSKNGEIQLNFYTDNWDQIGQNGLWAVWMSAADGLMLSEPVAVREQAGNSTSTLRLPNNVSRNDYLVVYEDVMNGYLKHSGKSTSEVLRKALNQRINYGRYPVIALQLSKLQTTTNSLLKPLDTDNDGVPDTLDAFPNDPNYAYDTDHDKMSDEWENFYGLDVLIDDSALDRDNDGISNLDEFNAKTDPGHLAVTLTAGDKQVTLSWQPLLNTQAQSICWSAKPLAQPVSSCVTRDNSPSTWLINQSSPATIKKLSNGKAYYFAVIAQDSSGKLIESKLLTATPGKAAALNDTGITSDQCYQQDSNALVACTGAAATALSNSQDGMVGRDVTANANNDGHAGFSFTKISSTGAALPVTANSWACVKDNVTGLMWENKTADGGLHDGNNGYTQYSADYGPGNLGAATDASGFVAAVNQQSLCGAGNWRLPSADELQSIVDYSIAYPGPTIDTAFFPNTQQNAFWSSSPYVGYTSYAWDVVFSNGDVSGSSRGGSLPVRLVRASQ